MLYTLTQEEYDALTIRSERIHLDAEKKADAELTRMKEALAAVLFAHVRESYLPDYVTRECLNRFTQICKQNHVTLPSEEQDND